MTLVDSANFALAIGGEFAGPLRAAIAETAVAILNEDESIPLHAERVTLAKRALRNPGSVTDAFSWALSTNPTVTQKWTEGDHDGAFGDFLYVLSTVWDAIAVSWDVV